ncbi:MAG: hypothetical protein ACRD3W_16355, partial [Terriglobales bacterium]
VQIEQSIKNGDQEKARDSIEALSADLKEQLDLVKQAELSTKYASAGKYKYGGSQAAGSESPGQNPQRRPVRDRQQQMQERKAQHQAERRNNAPKAATPWGTSSNR